MPVPGIQVEILSAITCKETLSLHRQLHHLSRAAGKSLYQVTGLLYLALNSSFIFTFFIFCCFRSSVNNFGFVSHTWQGWLYFFCLPYRSIRNYNRPIEIHAQKFKGDVSWILFSTLLNKKNIRQLNGLRLL